MTKINLKNLNICENAIISFDGKVSLINIFTDISAKEFPTTFPKFAILASIEGENGMYSETIEIVSPTGQTIASTIGNAEIKNQGGNSFVANYVNTQFPTEGLYWIKVTVDGNVLTNKINHCVLVKKI